MCEKGEVSQKLYSLIQSTDSLQNFFSQSYESSQILPADREVLKVLPTALGQYKLLLESLSDEWRKIIEANVDLGTVTSYEGSVFNPQEIPLVQVVHCIVSDMDMLLNEVSTDLSSSTAVNYTDIINKVYAVIGTLKFLYQTKCKVILPKQFEANMDEITNCLPGYETRLQAIGVQ